MPEPEPIDHEALRKRLPWVGPCSSVRNNVRRGPFLEAQLPAAMTADTGDEPET